METTRGQIDRAIRTMQALIEAIGMFSTNMQRQSLGQAMAYTDNEFVGLMERYNLLTEKAREGKRE